MSLYDPIRFHARLSPELPGLVALDSSVRELSYADIARRVDAATQMLARTATISRQVVSVHCEDRLLQIIVLLALSQLGGTTVVVSSDGASGFASTAVRVRDEPGADGKERTLAVDAAPSRAPGEGGGGSAPARPIGPTNWVFDRGSGAGAIAIDERVLMARIAQRSRAKAGGGAARWLCAVDIHSELGLSAVIECLWTGGLAVLSSGALEDDIAPIGLYDADHLLIDADLAPGYLRIFDRTISRISPRVRAAVVAGGRLDEEAVQRLKRQVSPATVVHLDLPEIGTFAACSNWNIDKARRYWPLPGVSLRILARRGEGPEAGSFGDVSIRSQVAARPLLVGAVSNPFEDGWFCSSLKGSITRDNALMLG